MQQDLPRQQEVAAGVGAWWAAPRSAGKFLDLERACSKVRFNKRMGKNKFYHTILFHSLPQVE